jgi:hypothetical protein
MAASSRVLTPHDLLLESETVRALEAIEFSG